MVTSLHYTVTKLLMSDSLIDKYISALLKLGRTQATITAYRKDLLQLIEMTDKELGMLTKDDIVKLLSAYSKKFASKTVSRKVNCYRAFFKYLVEQGAVQSNPLAEIENPQIKQTGCRVLTKIEYLALKEVSRNNTRLYTMIELLLQTGIRIGELSRLKISDVIINGQASSLHISSYSSTPARNIPLNNRAIEALERFLKENPASTPSIPLFRTRDDTPVIIRNIRSSISLAMQKAGIEKASVNDIRNTFIVVQLTSGVSADLVASVAGHRSRTSIGKYMKMVDKYVDKGISKIVEV
jgi:site-specific recombinase XerD